MLSSYLLQNPLPKTDEVQANILKMPKHHLAHVDTIIIGAGPAGRRAAKRISAAGKSCIIVDPVEFPGGSNLVAGAVASKTMWKYIERHLPEIEKPGGAGLPYKEGAELFETIKNNVRRVINVEGKENLAKVYTPDQLAEDQSVVKPTFIQGWAQITPSFKVAIHNNNEIQVVDSDKIVIATGSTPRQIPSLPWTDQRILSSDDILSLKTLPKSLVIVGAGIVGIEYAFYFKALGVDVTLINRSDGILTGTEDIINQGVRHSLEQLGVNIISSNGVQSCSINGLAAKSVDLVLNDETCLQCDAVLVAAGRVPNTNHLVMKSENGLDEFLQSRSLTPKTFESNGSTVEIGVIGDLGSDGGVVPKALNQGYRLGEYFAGNKEWNYHQSVDTAVPTALFSLPPAAYVGLTETEALHKGYNVVCGSAHIDENAMSTIGDTANGELKLVFDSKNGALIGAHIFGPEAHELINLAIPYLNREGALEELQNCSFAYPSLSGLYRQAAHTIQTGAMPQNISVCHVSSDIIRVPGRMQLAEAIRSFPTDSRTTKSISIQPKEVLGVHKSSLWARILKKAGGNQDIVIQQCKDQHIDLKNIMESHLEQEKAIKEFKNAFPEANLVDHDTFEQLCSAEQLDQIKAIIALGGDNHVQWVSHKVREQQIFIGVNSDPIFSAGNTLEFTWHELNGIRANLIQGSYLAKPVTRIQAKLDGVTLPMALSEIFIGRKESINTATIAELIQSEDDEFVTKVRSKSSGYLVASPTGSTGWTGKVLHEQFHFDPAIDSSKQGAFVVRREHFSGGSHSATASTLQSSQVLRLVSEMNEGGIVAIDCDASTQFSFPRGTELTISIAEQPLWWFTLKN